MNWVAGVMEGVGLISPRDERASGGAGNSAGKRNTDLNDAADQRGSGGDAVRIVSGPGQRSHGSTSASASSRTRKKRARYDASADEINSAASAGAGAGAGAAGAASVAPGAASASDGAPSLKRSRPSQFTSASASSAVGKSASSSRKPLPAAESTPTPNGYNPGDIIDYGANLSDHVFISRVESDPVAHRLRGIMADSAQVLTFPVVRRLSGSLVSMTHRQLMEHIVSSRSQRHVFTDDMATIVRRLADHGRNQHMFNSPVTELRADLPNYADIIKEPMDLGLVRERVVSGQYLRLSDFYHDVSLVFDNAILYNDEKQHVHKSAVFLKSIFESEFKKLVTQYRDHVRAPADLLHDILRQRHANLTPHVSSRKIKQKKAQVGKRKGARGACALPPPIPPQLQPPHPPHLSAGAPAGAGRPRPSVATAAAVAAETSALKPGAAASLPGSAVAVHQQLNVGRNSSPFQPLTVDATAPAVLPVSSSSSLSSTTHSKTGRDISALADDPTCAQALENMRFSSTRNPCGLCRSKEIALTTAVIRCGATCGQRIQRGGIYYVSPTPNMEGLAQHWCLKCYNALSSTFSDLLGGETEKDKLIRKINDEVNFEKWIKCVTCSRSFHQACALYIPNLSVNAQPPYNGLCWNATHEGPNNEALDPNFVCPLCMAVPEVWTAGDRVSAAMGVRGRGLSSSSTTPGGTFSDVTVSMPATTGDASSSSKSSSGSSTSGLREGSVVLPSSLSFSSSSSYAATSPIVSSSTARTPINTNLGARRPRAASSLRPRSTSSLGSGFQRHPYKDVPRILTREFIGMHEARDFSAASLPQSTMSAAMERRLRKRVKNEARKRGMERDVATTFLASITIRCFSGSVRGQKRWKRINQWIKVQRNLYKEEAGRKEVAADKSGVNIKSGISSDVESSASGAGSSVCVEIGVKKEGDLPFSGSRLDSVFSENKPEKHASTPPSGVTFAAHEFPHHPTVVMLFQEIDGVDVCLFAMYVNEFGSDCPPPNRNKVYISYLDSANFMQPSCFRTPVYHELMLGYLQDAKARGFSSVYIWACPPPPRAGDSYILSVHPKWQRTPNTERLVKWYKSIEELALKEKILVSSEGILDAHFNGHRQFRATRHSKGRMGRNKGSKRAKTEAVPPPASNGRSSVPVDTAGSRRRGGARRGGISNSGALTAPPSEDSSGSLPALSSSVPPEAAATQQNKKQCLQKSDDATLAARDAIASVYQIPYFSGDFWVGEVEKLLFELDGYGLPGDPDAAMRYWWQQQAKLLKRREAAAAGKPLPPTPKPKPRTPSPKPNYPRTLRAVLPEDSNSSLLYFARKTLQTASSSSSSSSSSSASEPDAQPGQVKTYKRYNVVRFRMMDSDMSAILTRRIEDQAYTRAVIRRIEEEEAKAKRLAAIPTHKPTFEEREAWIMSHLKTRISPMADQFLVWHLNPECYYCGKVVSRGKCWLYEATIAKTPGKPKLRRYLCTSCHKIPRAKAELHVLLGQAGAKKNSHHKKKPLVNISPYDVPVAGAPPAGSRGARAQHRIPEVPKSSIFDTRMGVLAYAQRMGFQFDQLRRAKHSSMMLLLQLHRSMLKQEKAQVGQVSKAGKRVGVRQSL